MKRGIGYYVHHHGAGHRERAIGIARALRRPCTLIGTFSAVDAPISDPDIAFLDLPDDRIAPSFDGRDGATARPLCLHYAPLGHPGIRTRMAAIAEWAAKTDPILMVVDVSVEVALFARLLSLPTLVVRLAGDRSDPAHFEAFRSAERLIATFPEAFDSVNLPGWVRAKTHFAGLLGSADSANSASIASDGRIVVVFGRGGEGGSLATLADAARAVPERTWHVLGPVQNDAAGLDLPANLLLEGWVDDVSARIAPAALVVGGAGDGVLGAVARAGKRFICLPEPRPYGEQTAKAEAMARLGAAVVHREWPEAGDWPSLVAQALVLDPESIKALTRPDGIERLANAIDAVAEEIEARGRSVF